MKSVLLNLMVIRSPELAARCWSSSSSSCDSDNCRPRSDVAGDDVDEEEGVVASCDELEVALFELSDDSSLSSVELELKSCSSLLSLLLVTTGSELSRTFKH